MSPPFGLSGRALRGLYECLYSLAQYASTVGRFKSCTQYVCEKCGFVRVLGSQVLSPYLSKSCSDCHFQSLPPQSYICEPGWSPPQWSPLRERAPSLARKYQTWVLVSSDSKKLFMYPKTFYGHNYKKLEHLSLSVTPIVLYYKGKLLASPANIRLERE